MTQTTTAETLNYSDLIGIKYKDRGRDKSGYDCYGLCIEVGKRLGHTLRDVNYENHNADLCDLLAPTLNIERTEKAALGVICEMRINGTAHIGICLNDKEFIHCTTNQGVKVSPLKAYPINDFYIIKE